MYTHTHIYIYIYVCVYIFYIYICYAGGRTCVPDASIETSGSLLSDPAPFFGFVCGPVGSKNGFVCRPVGDPIFGFACGAVGEDGFGEFPVIAASRSS